MANQAEITQDQKQKMLNYFTDRYSGKSLALKGCIAGTVVFGIIGISNLQYRLKLVRLAEKLSGEKYRVDIGGWMMLFILFAIATVVMLVLGYQKFYGDKTPEKCMKKGAYSCEYVTISQKKPDNGKPPYDLVDSLGNTLTCPVYLDYKAAGPGTTMVGVYLDNGMRFALTDAAMQNDY